MMKKLFSLSLVFFGALTISLNGYAQTDGFPGTTLEFDGDNDYVEIADDNSLDLTNNYTIEAWIKPEVFKWLGGIVSKYQESGANGYYLRLLSDSPYTGLNFDGMKTDTGILEANKWYHIAAVNDNGTRKLYLNGELQNLSGTANTIQANDNDLTIGVDYKSSGRYFEGEIDEVRIWNVARSDSALRENIYRPLSGNETGLISYWQFNDGSGTTLSDAHSTNDGTLHNMDNAEWVNSSIPFGSGEANTQIVSTTGNVVFTNTGLSMNFTAKTGADTIVVTRIDTTANVSPTGVETTFNSQYWVADDFGSGTFTADLQFTTTEDLTVEDQANPGRIVLLTREDNSDKGWGVCARASSVDASSNQVVFSGISSLGQFIIGRNPEPNNYPGNTLEFDGIDDYVYCDNNLNLNIDDSLSMEVWIKHDSLPSGKIQRYITLEPEIAVLRYDGTINGGKDELHFYIKQSDGSLYHIRVDSVLSENEWLHVAGTYDGTTMKLYLNGELIGIATPDVGGLSANNGKITISRSTESFSGKMDELRLWRQARTSSEIRENMYLSLTGNETNLVSYWQFNTGIGTTLLEPVSGNDGILHNMSGSEWVTSTIPFGGGEANSQVVTSTGNVVFTNTGLSMDFTAKTGTDTIVVTRIDTTANVSPTRVETIFDSQYWVADDFGGGTFTANLQFTTTENLTAEDQADPVYIVLYTRKNNSEGEWTLLARATSVDASTNTVLFSNIDTLGQFIIGRKIKPDNYPGTALEFDGSNDYVNIGNDTTLNIGSTLTIEAWVRPTDLSDRHSIYSTRKDNQAGSFQLEIGPGNGGTNRVVITGQGTWVAETEDSAIAINQWNHIVYTRSGTGAGTHTIYVNGEKQPLLTDANYTYADNTSDKVIASGTSGGQLFKGRIDELRLWNRVRTQSEIRENMYFPLTGLENGLISYWQFNDGSSTTLSDVLSINNGTLHNMDNADWVNSTIPFGDGAANTQIVSTTGNVTFTNTGITMNFIQKAGTDTIVVSRIDSLANVSPVYVDYVFDNQYWAVNKYGSGTFETGLTFSLDEDLTSADESEPENIKLYTRGSNSDTSWVLLASADSVNAANNQATFNGITDFYQFIIAKGQGTQATLSAEELSFSTCLNRTVSDTLTIHNNGDDSLVSSSISNNKPEFIINVSSCTIPPHDSCRIVVSFTPDSVVFTPDTLTITFTGYVDSVKKVTLLGKVFVPGISTVGTRITFEKISDNLLNQTQNDLEDLFPDFADINNDGLVDVIIGNFLFNLHHYKQTQINGTTYTLISNCFSGIDINNYTAPCLTDIDGDGLWDLIIGSSGKHLLHYEQNSKNSYSFSFVTDNFSSIPVYTMPRPVFYDIDGDYLLDLIIGKSDGTLSHYEQDSVNSSSFSFVSDNFNSIDIGTLASAEFMKTTSNGLVNMFIGGSSVGNKNKLFHYIQDTINSYSFTIVDSLMFSTMYSSFNPVFCDMDNDGTQELTISHNRMMYYEQPQLTSIGFNTRPIGYTAKKSYILNAANLVGDLHVECSGDFKISLSETGTYSSALSISPVNGSVSQMIYVSFEPDTTIHYTGHIVHTSAYADTIDIPVDGYGDEIKGLAGTALEFDGVDEYLNIGNSTSLDFGNVFTIEAWIKPSGLNGNFGIFSTGKDDELGYFQLEAGTGDNGTNRLSIVANGTIIAQTGDNAVIPDEWNHIAYSHSDDGANNFYVNGVKQTLITDTVYSFPNNRNNKLIAWGKDGNFKGKIDEVRLWNVTRTPDEIRKNIYVPLTPADSGLVSYWQFNGSSDSTAIDLINGNDGSFINMQEENRVTSTIPFSNGQSNVQVVDSTGEITFSGTGVVMNLTEKTGRDTIVVCRIDDNPNINPDDVSATYDQQYWEINQFGNGTFSADITFTLSEDITTEEAEDPGRVQLFTRSSYSDSNWVLAAYASSVDVDNDKVTFSGITNFCQFIITKRKHPDINVNPIHVVAYSGEETTVTVPVYNTGSDTLFITEISNHIPLVDIDTTECSVPPFDSCEITLSFSYTLSREFEDTLTISSNDLDSSEYKVAFKVQSFYPRIHSLHLPVTYHAIGKTISGNQSKNTFAPAFADINGNGLLDLINGGFDPDGGFSALDFYEQSATDPYSYNLINDSYIIHKTDSVGWPDPVITDLDHDGLLDLIVIGEGGFMNHYEQDSLFSTDFTLVKEHFVPTSTSNNRRMSLIITDFEHDGLLDMLVGEETVGVKHYRQDSINSTSFTLIDNHFCNIPSYNIMITDIDNDGLLDLFAGYNKISDNLHYEQDSINSSSFSLAGQDNEFVFIFYYNLCPDNKIGFHNLDPNGYINMIYSFFIADRKIHWSEAESRNSIDFGSVVLNSYIQDSYLITANDLVGDLFLNSTENFQLSLSASGGFTNSLQITPVNGKVSDIIFVRFVPDSLGLYTGEIAQTSANAATKYIHLTGRSSTINNFPGTALEFDGNNDYVDCGNNSCFKITDSLTIEAWIKADQWKDETYKEHIVSKEQNGMTAAYMLRCGDNGLVDFSIGIGGSWHKITLDQSDSLSLNTWYHIAAVYDGASQKIYINGMLKKEDTVSGSITANNTSLCIGTSSGYHDRTFSGKIDEVRIWNVARTDSALRENMYRPLTGMESGLVSYWQFNEGSGDTLMEPVSPNKAILHNMNDADWVSSSIPFGGGEASTRIVSTTGNVAFANTGFSMDFTSITGTDTIVVTRIDTTANVSPIGVETIFDSRYWVADDFGSGTFTANLQFTTTEDLTAEDQADPGRIVLFTREDNSDEDWGVCARASSVDTSSNQVVFSNISSLGQFIIGRNPVLDNFPGYALEFDGTNDYVYCDNNLNLNIGDSLSMEVWIKHDSLPSGKIQRYITLEPEIAVLRYDGIQGTDQLHFYIKQSNGSLYHLRVNNALSKNEWLHVAGTYDGTTMKLYLNGELIGTATPNVGGLSANNGKITISRSSESFSGKMDELRLWRQARTPSEIRENIYLPLTGNEAGLVSYWQFNTGYGTTLLEPISYNDGILHNMDNADWVNSTIPFGSGAANTQIVSSTGNVVFTNTGISMNFTVKTGTDTIVVSRIDTTANVSPTRVETIFDSQYWVADDFGGGTFTANLQFTTTEDLTAEDQSDPANIVLYTRESNSDGDWTALARASSVDASTNMAVFSNISSLGQFIIARKIEPDKYPGTALEFDGNNDYVEIADDNTLDLTNNYTIEAWIKPEAFHKYGGIVSKFQKSGANGYYLRLTPYYPYTGLNFDGMKTNTGILEAGKWYHVAAVNDNGTRKLYLNGKLQNLWGTANTIQVNDNELTIGVDYKSAGRYFEGKIDEVRIWDMVLSDSVLRENMYLPLTGFENGLVSYWQFNDGSGDTLQECTGNNGILHNMADTSWVTSTIPFGDGAANTQIVGSTGNVVFTNTGVSMDFTEKTGTDAIVVTRIDTTANLNPDGVTEVFDAQYWDVNRYGSGSLKADPTFTLSEDILPAHHTPPAGIVLFNRYNTADGKWSYLLTASAADDVNDRVTFSGITGFGQFIVCYANDLRPSIALESDSLDFGKTFPGHSISRNMMIYNDGFDTLNISNISCDNADFMVNFTSYGIPGRDSVELQITFTPSIEGVISGTLAISSNDHDKPVVYVKLTGEGISLDHFSGAALEFDGDNDYVEIADDNTLDLTNNYTIEAWIKPSVFHWLGGILCKYQSPDAKGYYLRFSPDSPYTGLNFDGMKTATGILEANKWYHVAAVNDNGTRKLYLNGELQSLSGTANTIQTNDNVLTIGIDYKSAGRYFEGEIDEVSIWNTVLTQQQIRDNMHRTLTGNESGLVAYWQFNEVSGTTAKDFFNNCNGTLTNMDDDDWVPSTAPIPFITVTNGPWEQNTIWDAGQNVPVNPWSRVKIKHNITLNSNMEVIEITVDTNAVMTISAGDTLTVTGNKP